jgi:predicted transcriptional regulator
MTGENTASVPAITTAAAIPSVSKHRRSLLELAPLELDCMNALWILGPATVRDVRDRIAPDRPRAYTTIMTILDRLARKGAVDRAKVGRAYLYRANLSAEDARTHAVGQVIENFFGGSSEALLSQLHNSGVGIARKARPRSIQAAAPLVSSAATERPAVMAAAAGAASASLSSFSERNSEPQAEQRAEREPERAPQPDRRRLDETLL